MEGYQPRPFGYEVGSHFHHEPRFPGPPYDPGRSDFPSPVLTLAFLLGPSQRWRGLSAGSRTPLPPLVYPWARPYLASNRSPGTASGRALGPPSAQSLFAWCRVLPSPERPPAPLRKALPFLRSSYRLMRQTILLPPFSVSLYGGSLQVAASPCWKMALPDVISAILVQLSGPLPRRTPPVLLSVSSRRTSASRHGLLVRRARIFLQCNFSRAAISGLQSFTNVQTSVLAWPTGCTHRRTPVLGGWAVYTTQNLSRYLPKQWHRYLTEPDNCQGWTFTSRIAALSAAPNRVAAAPDWPARGPSSQARAM